MSSPLLRAAHDLLEFALPQRCPVCGEAASAERLWCARCEAALPHIVQALCARCLREEQPAWPCNRHAGDQVQAAWLYDDSVALLVHALKFGARPRLARAHAGAIAAAIPEQHRHPAIVTGVPLHPVRLRERGYDQAACLAAALADALGVPFVPGLLVRTRETRAQSTLGPRARRDNVAGAFQVAHPAWVRGREVLVVDDVLTTGATLGECLAVLRASGARTRAAVLAWAQ
jgi:ComF family protein